MHSLGVFLRTEEHKLKAVESDIPFQFYNNENENKIWLKFSLEAIYQVVLTNCGCCLKIVSTQMTQWEKKWNLTFILPYKIYTNFVLKGLIYFWTL